MAKYVLNCLKGGKVLDTTLFEAETLADARAYAHARVSTCDEVEVWRGGECVYRERRANDASA